MKPAPDIFNHRMNQVRPEGYAALRVWDIPATKKRGPHLRIKCGCCDQKIVIHYGVGEDGDTLEINGVFGSVENWREILLPLLEWKPPATKRPAKKTVRKKKQAQ
jgi:hypothetical protein